MERTFELKNIVVEFICPKCDKAPMARVGPALFGQYPYTCTDTDCKHTTTTDKIYPRQRVDRVEVKGN